MEKGSTARVVLHIDMDCFYVQVERSINPSLLGVPCAVSQYNPFGNTKTVAPSDPRLWLDSNGSLIAVSYEARAAGVKRNMRAAEARKLCPQIQVVQVPVDHNKADLTPYREAGARVVQVFQKNIKNAIIEKSSVDEVYLDVTEECQRRLTIINNSLNPSEAFDTLVEIARRESSIAGDDTEELKMSKESLRRGHSGTKTTLGSITEEEDRDDHVDTITTTSSISSSSSSTHDSNDITNPSAASSFATALLPTVTEAAAAAAPSSSSSSSSTTSRSWFDDPQLQWSNENQLIIVGAVIAKELRNECFKTLGFTCSAGISANKMLSKIASAMHKPNRQTVVPPQQVEAMMLDLPINRVVGFGGKLGDDLGDFNGKKIVTFRDLLNVNRHELQACFGEDRTTWMLQKAIGVDTELVQDRALVNSIGCSKSFRQQNMLPQASLQDGRVLHWLKELAQELEERITNDTQLHQRKPKTLTVGLNIASVVSTTTSGASKTSADPVRKWHEEQGTTLSKVGQMCIGAAAIARAAHSMACRAVADCTRLGNKPWNITYLSLNATSFFPLANDSKAISSFFKAVSSPNKASPKGKFSYNGNSADIGVISCSSSSSSSSSSSGGTLGSDCAVAMEVEFGISIKKQGEEKEHEQQQEKVQQPGMATEDNDDNDDDDDYQQQQHQQPQPELGNEIDMCHNSNNKHNSNDHNSCHNININDSNDSSSSNNINCSENNGITNNNDDNDDDDSRDVVPGGITANTDMERYGCNAEMTAAASSTTASSSSSSSSFSVQPPAGMETGTGRGGEVGKWGGGREGGGGVPMNTKALLVEKRSFQCPICSKNIVGTVVTLNKHIDECLLVGSATKSLELSSSPAGMKQPNNHQSSNPPLAQIDSDNDSDVVILDNHPPIHQSNNAVNSSNNAAAAIVNDKSSSSSSSSSSSTNNNHKRPARELSNSEKLTLKLKRTKGIERFWG